MTKTLIDYTKPIEFVDGSTVAYNRAPTNDDPVEVVWIVHGNYYDKFGDHIYSFAKSVRNIAPPVVIDWTKPIELIGDDRAVSVLRVKTDELDGKGKVVGAEVLIAGDIGGSRSYNAGGQHYANAQPRIRNVIIPKIKRKQALILAAQVLYGAGNWRLDQPASLSDTLTPDQQARMWLALRNALELFDA